MSAKPKNYMLVIGEPEALMWILRERRMTFRRRPNAKSTRLLSLTGSC